jgi:Fic family protein
MDTRCSHNSAAGQVIRVGGGEAAYWAFIPNPLPPKLPLDWPLMKVLSEADRALGQLAGLGRTVPNPHLLIRPFVRREAVLSSLLRGVAEQSRDAIARARRLQDLREEWRRRMLQGCASALTLQLLDALFATPIITIPQAQRRLKATYPGAKYACDKPVRAGIPQPVGDVSYGKTYQTKAVLEVITGEHIPE